MDAEIAAAIAQFGAAGLIGWMWLSERRASGERDRQLSEAHERVVRDREDRAALIGAVRDATSAMVSIEHGQRALASIVERALGRGEPAGGGGAGEGGRG